MAVGVEEEVAEAGREERRLVFRPSTARHSSSAPATDRPLGLRTSPLVGKSYCQASRTHVRLLVHSAPRAKLAHFRPLYAPTHTKSGRKRHQVKPNRMPNLQQDRW